VAHDHQLPSKENLMIRTDRTQQDLDFVVTERLRAQRLATTDAPLDAHLAKVELDTAEAARVAAWERSAAIDSDPLSSDLESREASEELARRAQLVLHLRWLERARACGSDIVCACHSPAPSRQPRERAVPCVSCRPSAPTTWNTSGRCDRHELALQQRVSV
jgi:hypothetical protein